jgi:hypothetical protein
MSGQCVITTIRNGDETCWCSLQGPPQQTGKLHQTTFLWRRRNRGTKGQSVNTTETEFVPKWRAYVFCISCNLDRLPAPLHTSVPSHWNIYTCWGYRSPSGATRGLQLYFSGMPRIHGYGRVLRLAAVTSVVLSFITSVFGI